VIRKEVFQRRIRYERGEELVRQLTRLPIRIVSSTQQFTRGYELAARFQHKRAYDMQYAAVAELEGAQLMTVDRDLRHAAQELGLPVQYLR
jgi:predicted nucleic acid-binding protein